MLARVTETGLKPRWRPEIPWSDVLCVRHVAADRALVYTVRGTVKVDHATAAAVEQRLAPWEAERAAWAAGLSDEQRADWLGLGPGDAVTLKVNRAGRVVGLVVLVAMAFGLGVMLAAAGLWTALFVLATGTVALLARTLIGLRVQHGDWVVDGQGLQVGDRLIRWSQVRDVFEWTSPWAGNAGALSVLTDEGEQTLVTTGTDLPRVVQAFRRWRAERDLAVPAPAGRLYPSGIWRGGLYVDERGLWRLRSAGAELVPWSEVRGVRWLGHFAEVRLAGDQRLPLLRVRGGNALAEAIDQRLAGGESVVDAQGQLRGEVIERWLGVAPGGAVHCRLSQWVAIGLPALLLIMIAGFVATIGSGGGGMAAQFPTFIMMAAFAIGSARSVRADAEGLSIRRRGRREYYAWSEIEGLKQDSYGVVIATSRGPVKLSSFAKNQQLVVGIINRILTARAGGAALPDRVPLPETALSRMTGAVSSGDRGLSVAVGADEPRDG